MERLGSDAILYLDADGVGPLTVRTDGETDVAIGDTVFATPRPGREHRFRAGRPDSEPDLIHVVGALGTELWKINGLRLIPVGTQVHPAPPGQIRACAANALGSHLGCLTRKRCCGQGWLILAGGSQRAAIRPIRAHVTRPFWLRRESARRQCHTTKW